MSNDDVSTPPTRGRLEVLDEATCWRLLGSEGVGRLSWTSSSHPLIIPVNYRVQHGRLEIVTAAHSSIARECDDSYVALEADRTSHAQHSGWSVVIQGIASLDYEHPATEEPRPWPAGIRRQRLVVRPTSVTGRRLT